MLRSSNSPRRKRSRQFVEKRPTTDSHARPLYHVDWAAPERGQQQPIQLVAVTYPQHQTKAKSLPLSSSATQIAPPAAQLSLQQLSPVPNSVWSYTVFLGIALLLWVLYLLLPRGFRKKYLNANRKRYAKRTQTDMPAAGYWLPANKTLSDAGGSSVAAMGIGNSNTNKPPILQASSTFSSMEATPSRTTAAAAFRTSYSSGNDIGRTPPSPEHPALKKIPPQKIISETMGRLQGRGIRLVAHGVHCDPKRVWVKLDDETKSVTWQTEFPRRVPNQSGQVSIVLMRGSVHRIALTNVLYIDVGKKTNALQRLQESKVPDATCFSLLTQNGSLDLQANSKLERDSLVSCFSIILDEIHANEDWRALYETSPDPSLVNSSTAGGGTRPTPASGGAGAPRSAAASHYPDPSDHLVEV